VVNVPTSAIALLLPFDRILDRFRTMTNVWGDLVCAATVDHFASKKSVELQVAPVKKQIEMVG
jgi:Na+/H+-dicarboxylate symporter